MPQRISKKTLYLNADKSAVVGEGDPAAAFLLVRAGSAVNEDEVARLEKNGLKVTIPTEDVPAAATAESEDTEAKAKPAAENKAVTKAPANKGK
jgi:hypothetical protein